MFLKIFRIVLILIIGSFSLIIISNINYFIKEENILREVIKDNHITKVQIYDKISNIKNIIVENYINAPKTKFQFDIWVKSRGVLRQTALETLEGKVGVCGELSRVMIKLLRSLGIKARRLYVYGKKGTSHVMFEFYNENKKQWIIANSYKSTKYLEDFLQGKNITVQELFKEADPEKLKYKYFSNLNYPLTKIFGYKYDILYFISYFMDEIYFLKIIFFSLLLLFSIIGYFLLREKE